MLNPFPPLEGQPEPWRCLADCLRDTHNDLRQRILQRIEERAVNGAPPALEEVGAAKHRRWPLGDIGEYVPAPGHEQVFVQLRTMRPRDYALIEARRLQVLCELADLQADDDEADEDDTPVDQVSVAHVSGRLIEVFLDGVRAGLWAIEVRTPGGEVLWAASYSAAERAWDPDVLDKLERADLIPALYTAIRGFHEVPQASRGNFGGQQPSTSRHPSSTATPARSSSGVSGGAAAGASSDGSGRPTSPTSAPNGTSSTSRGSPTPSSTTTTPEASSAPG